MRLILIFSITCMLVYPSVLFASDEVLNSGSATIDVLLELAISRNLISGGVVAIGNHSGILHTIARGRLNTSPAAPLLNERTIFDIASLTKVIATAPAVMKLLDEGRISLMDPLTRWFPEFKSSGREDITILNLLTHTSGLDDFELSGEQAMKTAIQKAAAQKYRQRPGSRFHYADINFILLGELVRRISDRPLNIFCQEQIYDPLGIHETMFLPPGSLAETIAPTIGPAVGIVQDPNARRLGGVAGHAGLFSSAHDLAQYARLILGGGAIDGRRILSEIVVSQMTAPYLCNSGTVVRGLGWDMKSPYSAPKGILFSERSFGHTGYSGSSIWIDPQRDLFVVLLTNRSNYRDIGLFNQLRRDISTVAVADFRTSGDSQELSATGEVARLATDLLGETPKTTIQPPSHGIKRTAQSNLKRQHQKRAHQHINRAERRLVKAIDATRRAGKRRS